MVNIVLFCNAGMSTSMLVSKMKDVANKKNLEVSIKALPEAQLEKSLEGVDVILLGPQIKFMLSKVEGICNEKGIPVEVISAADYGMMNGEKVLDRALKLAGK